MKIICVTPNPAIDLTVHAAGWQRGIVNRGQRLDNTAGGKALTVAVALADSGLSPVVTGWMGDKNDVVFVDTFKAHNVKDEFLRIDGKTRSCIKIIDDNDGDTSDFNMPGAEISAQSQQELQAYLDKEVDKDTTLIFGGSLPAGVEKDYYAQIAKRYRDKCRYLVIDTSDKALEELMKSDVLPHMIKPNILELEGLCNRKLNSKEEIIAQAREFVKRGIELVVVSMGGDGAMYVTKDEALHAAAPKVQVVSTVGAGDTMVAGTVRGLLLGQSLAEMATNATAWGAGKIQFMGLGLPKAEVIEELKKQVRITHF